MSFTVYVMATLQKIKNRVTLLLLDKNVNWVLFNANLIKHCSLQHFVTTQRPKHINLNLTPPDNLPVLSWIDSLPPFLTKKKHTKELKL